MTIGLRRWIPRFDLPLPQLGFARCRTRGVRFSPSDGSGSIQADPRTAENCEVLKDYARGQSVQLLRQSE